MHVEKHQQHHEQGDAEDEDNEPQSCVKVSNPSPFYNACDLFDLNHYHLYDSYEDSEQQIKNEEDEVFPVVEPHTVVDPRTVMVHIEHALFALRAMMCPFWFEVAANKAKFTLMRVAVVHSPEQRNLAWVSDRNCDKRPYAH